MTVAGITLQLLGLLLLIALVVLAVVKRRRWPLYVLGVCLAVFVIGFLLFGIGGEEGGGRAP